MMKVNEIDYIYGMTGEVIDSPSKWNVEDMIIVDIRYTEENCYIYVVYDIDEVISYTAFINRNEMSYEDFLQECICCGGDWVSMLFTGLKHFYRPVWDIIPNNKEFSFIDICKLLEECGVQITD